MVATALQDLLAALRAAHFVHWTNHWASRGEAFYGDHQLFGRLYEAVVEEIDGLAEKLVALDVQAVEPQDAIARMVEYVNTWTAEGDILAQSTRAEQDLQDIVAGALAGENSVGMENFLQGIADAHETALYLLGQRRRTAAKIRTAYDVGTIKRILEQTLSPESEDGHITVWAEANEVYADFVAAEDFNRSYVLRQLRERLRSQRVQDVVIEFDRGEEATVTVTLPRD